MNRPTLTSGQNAWLDHMIRWGSDGYPVRRLGRSWTFEHAFGVGGSPVLYRTKREAVAACEAFEQLLLDYSAGRISNPATTNGGTA